MTHPDNNFKDKLYDLETPLGDNASFDKVMAMRSSRSGPGWWKPAMLVFATLSVVSVAGYFLGRGLGTGVGSTPEGTVQNGSSSKGGLNSQNMQKEDASTQALSKTQQDPGRVDGANSKHYQAV